MATITIRHTSECSYYENGNLCDCGARESLNVLEALPEGEFQSFYESLPARVRVLIGSGLVDWREVLPRWYAKFNENGTRK